MERLEGGRNEFCVLSDGERQLFTPSENVKIDGFKMIFKDADSQDIIQMNAFAKHPHEHRSDAELQEDDD